MIAALRTWRGRSWWVRGVGLLTGLALVLLVVYVAVLPGLVASRAAAALRALGWRDVRLEVRDVSLDGADVARISIGDARRLRVDHVRVDYTLTDLLRGRVGVVDVLGLELDVRRRDGAWDLGPLDELRGGGGSGGEVAELPFSRLVLRSARLAVDAGGGAGTLLVPVDATVEAAGTRLTFEVHARAAGADVRATGTLDLRPAALDLEVDGSVPELASVLAALSDGWRGLAGRPTGEFAFHARALHRDGVTRVEGSARGDGLAWSGRLDGRAVFVEGVELELSGARGRHAGSEPPALEAFDLSVRAAAIDASGLPPLEAAVRARREPSDTGVALHLEVAGRGGAGDRLTADALAAGLLGDAGTRRIDGGLEATLTAKTLLAHVPTLRARGTSLGGGEVTVVVTAEVDLGGGPDGLTAAATGRVRARLDDVTWQGGAASLREVSGDAAFSCALESDEVTLEVEPGARLELASPQLAPAGRGWTLTASDEESAVVELSEPLTVRAPRDAPPARWSVWGPGARARTPDLTVIHAESETRLDGLTLDVAGAFEVEEGRATGRVDTPSSLGVRELTMPGLVLTPLDPTSAADVLRVDCVEPAVVLAGEGVETGWSAEAPALRVRAGERDVTAAGGRLRVEGFSLDWTVGARATAGSGTLTSVRAGEVTASSATADAAGRSLRTGPLHLEVHPIGGTLADVAASGLSAGVRLAAGELALEADDLGAAVLDSVSLELEAKEGRDGVAVDGRLLAAGSASTSSGAAGNGALLVETGTVTLDATARARGQAWSVAGLSWEAEARAATDADGGITAAGSGLELEVGSTVVEASAEAPAGRPPVVRGVLRLDDASARSTRHRLDMQGIAAEVPFTTGEEMASEGRLRVGVIWSGDDLVPGFTGTASVAGGRARIGLEWPVLEGVTATGSAWLDVAAPIPRGEVVLRVPRFRFSDANQPSGVFGALAGVRLGGTLSLDARVGIEGPRIDPRVELVMEDGSLSAEKWDASAGGVDATLTLDGLDPPSTPGNQTVTVRRARLGRLEVKDGSVAFRLEGPRSLFVERTEWGWAGGRLYSHAIRFDPRRPELDLVVFADHLRLKELSELVGDGRFTGEGTLYGRLPVRIAWPDLSYGTGFLYAEPGVGSLQVLDAGGIWKRLPAEARGALRDFEFTVLKANLVTGGDAVVRLRGKSRDPAYPRDIILDVNLYGFADLLDAAIIVHRAPRRLLESWNGGER